MRFAGRLLPTSIATVLVAVAVAGCGSTPAAPRTVLVTETASTQATTDGGGSGSVTAPPLTAPSESAVDSSTSASPTSESVSSASESPSVSAAPFKSIDPLKVDCARIMTPSKLSEIYGGGLPGGTNRVVETANPDRGITGRVKCQYGVSADKTIIAVNVIFAQFTGADSAKAQVGVTVKDETDRGARASTTAIQGYPADVLLRDGGFLLMNYDTWNLSVVVANGVMDESKLPDALSATADYALTQAIA